MIDSTRSFCKGFLLETSKRTHSPAAAAKSVYDGTIRQAFDELNKDVDVPAKSDESSQTAEKTVRFNVELLRQQKNVLGLCRMRTDPEFVHILIKTHTGLKDEALLVQKMKFEMYVDVMIAIWSERDRSRRLTWLRQHAALHAPFLFELSIAEFKASPSHEILQRVSFPWFKAACLRVQQDASCFTDPSLQNVHREFENVYSKILAQLVYTQLKMPLPSPINEAVKATWQNIVEQTKAHRLPMPDWILSSGSSPNPQDRFPPVGFLTLCFQKRLQIVQEALENCNTRVFEELD